MPSIMETIERAAQKALAECEQKFSVEKNLTHERCLKINFLMDGENIQRVIKISFCGEKYYKLVTEVYVWRDNMQTFERRETSRMLPDILVPDISAGGADPSVLSRAIEYIVGAAFDTAWRMGEEDLILVSKLNINID